jgi:acyl-CoA thioester hydrolase
LLPVIELKCSYKSFAKYEDRIIVKTSVKELTYSRVVFYYEVFKNAETVPITTGETMHVWTDGNIKPFNLKKRRPQLYELMQKAI